MTAESWCSTPSRGRLNEFRFRTGLRTRPPPPPGPRRHGRLVEHRSHRPARQARRRLGFLRLPIDRPHSQTYHATQSDRTSPLGRRCARPNPHTGRRRFPTPATDVGASTRSRRRARTGRSGSRPAIASDHEPRRSHIAHSATLADPAQYGIRLRSLFCAISLAAAGHSWDVSVPPTFLVMCTKRNSAWPISNRSWPTGRYPRPA